MITLAAILLALARSFFDAFVVLCLWGWFLVPAGLHPIGYWNAYGLDVCIGLLVAAGWRYDLKGETSGELALTSIFGRGIAYAVVLAFGYFAHRMMVGA